MRRCWSVATGHRRFLVTQCFYPLDFFHHVTIAVTVHDVMALCANHKGVYQQSGSAMVVFYEYTYI